MEAGRTCFIVPLGRELIQVTSFGWFIRSLAVFSIESFLFFSLSPPFSYPSLSPYTPACLPEYTLCFSAWDTSELELIVHFF